MGRKLVLGVVVAVLGLAGCTPPSGQVPPTILKKSLPYGIVGQPYSAVLEAVGTGPFNWSMASGSLPDGLTLSPFGVISGTPTAAALGQNFQPFTVQASNVAGSGTRTFTIDVFTLSAPGSTVLPQSTGAPLPEGKAIAFTGYPATSGFTALPEPAMFQYLENGTITEVATLLTPTRGEGPTKPQPTQLTTHPSTSVLDLRSYNRQANLVAASNGIGVELRSGNPVNNTLLHTYIIPGGVWGPVRPLLSPDGQTLAIVMLNYDLWSTHVWFYSTSAPYQLLRPMAFYPQPFPNLGNFGLGLQWTPASDRFVVGLSSTMTEPSRVVVLDPHNPAGDVTPAAYEGCSLATVLSDNRLAVMCSTATSLPVKTGALDGTSVHTLYELGNPASIIDACFPRAGSPSGQFVALACLDTVNNTGTYLAYLPDQPMVPGVLASPVALTDPVPYVGGINSTDLALEWSNSTWPHVT